MSTTAPPSLFDGLLDDAAVFPPGSFSLREAIDRRRRRERTPVMRYTGPLLLPTRLIAEALDESDPLDIVVIGRPGSDLDEVLEAARMVARSRAHTLAGVEVPYADRWRDAMSSGVPLAIEVPAGPPGIDLLADLAEDTQDLQAPVRAKLRTGSTPANPVPTAEDLAGFIDACLERRMPFKLTGGLHHAVTGALDASGQTEFGFLNVLAATHAACDGARPDALARILDVRQAPPLAERLRVLTDRQVVRIREAFHSYGCCNVLDPIHDLTHLALIKESSSE